MEASAKQNCPWVDLSTLLQHIESRVKNVRRQLHAHPERAWLEYGTAALVAQECEALGMSVTLGAQALCAQSRLVPPSAIMCAQAKARAVAHGASQAHVDAFDDGLTALWVDIHFSDMPEGESGEHVLALRFDMDANDVTESCDAAHLPHEQGYASRYKGLMHACGHDGHVAMGVGLLHALHGLRTHMPHLCAGLAGTVRLIFQPAEEIGQGAKAMLDAGAMAHVRELIGIHLGIQAQERGKLICGTTHFLANSSFEIDFFGRAAHAGLAPHTGKNALMAAVSAIQSIQAIARHGDGASRVNIGQVHVDGAPNVIPAHCWLAGETRGMTTAINQWMLEEAMRKSAAAAAMWDCTHTFTQTGTCLSGTSDMDLAQEVHEIAAQMSCFRNIRLTEKFWASEDFTWFLHDVQSRGGRGTFVQLGIDWASGHHTASFDYNDDVLLEGVELLLRIILQKLSKE